ncbi:hypothetical protein, variant [Aphanomyces invadans]|uniref:Uncharacterized protein n=1 Tax=Aphanomyces invadans TaxID=157072 RepID=A0A024UUJ1_9STRA|nr:hypothetical protein, variant [Aphanomyces invadans]ETW09625.1 hypothetical protein, variant [Aphanomyces invadans]|eukprot:XP_008861036.1 hypothetical protein, variant [Aphanomyces invadans]
MLRRVNLADFGRACYGGSKRWMSMAGSVQFYRRQLIVLDPQRDAEAWPKKVEESTTHVISKYHNTVAPLNTEKSPTKLILATAYPYGDDPAVESASSTDTHDVLVFPDNLRISGVCDSDVDFLALHLLEDTLDLPLLRSRLSVSEMSGHHVFVCAHAKRYIHDFGQVLSPMLIPQ